MWKRCSTTPKRSIKGVYFGNMNVESIFTGQVLNEGQAKLWYSTFSIRCSTLKRSNPQTPPCQYTFLLNKASNCSIFSSKWSARAAPARFTFKSFWNRMALHTFSTAEKENRQLPILSPKLSVYSMYSKVKTKVATIYYLQTTDKISAISSAVESICSLIWSVAIDDLASPSILLIASTILL